MSLVPPSTPELARIKQEPRAPSSSSSSSLDPPTTTDAPFELATSHLFLLPLLPLAKRESGAVDDEDENEVGEACAGLRKRRLLHVSLEVWCETADGDARLAALAAFALRVAVQLSWSSLSPAQLAPRTSPSTILLDIKHESASPPSIPHRDPQPPAPAPPADSLTALYAFPPISHKVTSIIKQIITLESLGLYSQILQEPVMRVSCPEFSLTCYRIPWGLGKRWEWYQDGEEVEPCEFKLRFVFGAGTGVNSNSGLGKGADDELSEVRAGGSLE
ncbi:hypothetical protein MNV49_006064 [Pseudohyphozyma bogoriensis]|nr:hypothetical protein MNV49_006064 [Pseudohyphozyma bogoriensis]